MRSKQFSFTLPVGILSVFFMITSLQAQEMSLSADEQIKAAVSAAPENLKKGARVLGYDTEGKLVVLREGTDKLTCLADDPEEPKFHVACYFNGLEPFMKRGRELRAEGKSREEVEKMRRKEIESGKLKMPEKPMALYSLSGPEEGYDYSKGTVTEAKPLYVVYIPFATEEMTGISTSPAGPGAPWLMDSGKPWAHIMIPGSKVDGGNGTKKSNK